MPPDRPALVWTREAPTEAGWYWWRSDVSGGLPEIVELDRGGNIRDSGTLLISSPSSERYIRLCDVTGDVWWSGPIPLSKEAT